MTHLAKQYSISPMFAKHNQLPISFVAHVLRETERAVYLYGRGEMEPTGRCAKCGRILKHPGSIMLGIGPECIGNWGLRDIKMEEPTAEDLFKVKAAIHAQKVDQWIPKSCIKASSDSKEPILVPSDHKMVTSSTTPGAPSPTARRASLVSYQSTGDSVIKVEFPYSADDVALVKTIVGRKYSPEGKYWTAPLTVEAIETLKEKGFELSDAILEYLEKITATVTDESASSIEIPGLKGTLMPFQKTGVAFTDSRDGRALIGDEQGLGKTVQALAWLQLHPEARPAVVVCPASLKLNWEREAVKWMTNPNAQVLQGSDTSQPLYGDIIIINYDILGNSLETYKDTAGKTRKREIRNTGWVDYLVAYGVKAVVVDEVQYIKNNGIIRTIGTKRLARKADHVIGLSGTPIESRPVEFFNIIQLINRNIMPNWWSYVNTYCGAKHNGWGWDYSGASNTLELHQKLTNTIMIRRLKADVLPELPDKQYSYVPMDMDNWHEYSRARRDIVEYMRETKGNAAADTASGAKHLVQIEALKQLAVAGKLKQAISWIEDMIESGEKLVVFAVHKTVIDAVMDKFKGVAVKIDGSVSSQQRDNAVEAFQNDDKIRLFVGNIKAAGVGLTLTASSTVAFLELPWTSSDLAQAEDRCHRIGQKSSVNVHYLLAAGTIEEDIAELLDKKRKVLDSILDGKETENESLLVELMRRIDNSQERSN